MPLVDAISSATRMISASPIASIRPARRLLAKEPLAAKIAGELLPGAGIADEAGLAACCGKTVKTNYHPVGTAPMGRDGDSAAVLDARLRVRGVAGCASSTARQCRRFRPATPTRR